MIAESAPLRLLLGSGRSGTTWVLDSLANANDLRPIFEPLHEQESELGKEYAYHVLTPWEECVALETYFRDLSQGRIHSRWIDFRVDRLSPSRANFATFRTFRSWIRRWRKYIRDRSELWPSTRRTTPLIKCIRANLMAGWFAQHLGFRTALIVRHPCAVVESQLRIGRVWDPTPVIERYGLNERLHEITDGLYVPLLNSKLTRLQALTLNWIIENQTPVARAIEDGYVVAYYEHLLFHRLPAWAALCSALDLATVPSEKLLEEPSQSTSTIVSRAGSTGKREANWRKVLSPGQLAEVQEMLDATECNLYSVADEMPLQAGAYSK